MSSVQVPASSPEDRVAAVGGADRSPCAPVEAGPGRGLWWGLLAGLPLVAFGVAEALATAPRTHPGELARWIVGAAVVHDVLVLPVVLLVGLLGRAVVPAPAWPAVRWALATTGVVGLVSVPFVRGWGRSPDVPSLLDRPYGTGVLALLGVVWLVALVLAVAATRREARTRT